MIDRWDLPRQAVIGGKVYQLHADYRDILEIFSYLEDPDLPEYLRWQIAVALFYEEAVPEDCLQEAMEYLSVFLRCGEQEQGAPGPKLLDWEQDAGAIVADVNKVAGQEIRALPFLHWWTFLAYFHAIGEGQLSTLISLRDKLRRGKKLEPWEKDFYRENKRRVDLPRRYSREELQEQARLNRLLDEKEERKVT